MQCSTLYKVFISINLMNTGFIFCAQNKPNGKDLSWKKGDVLCMKVIRGQQYIQRQPIAPSCLFKVVQNKKKKVEEDGTIKRRIKLQDIDGKIHIFWATISQQKLEEGNQ